MADENKGIRLKKAATELNVGISTLVEFLAKKGHQVDDAPNTKINEAQYELLAAAFQSERKVKEMSLQEKKPKPRPKRVFAEPKEEKAWHPTPRYQGLDSQNTRKEYGSSVKPVRIGRK